MISAMKQTFDITGMTCAACSARVQKAASGVQGVQTAAVNLLKNSMDVTVADEADASLIAQAVCQAVEKAGYGATLRQPVSVPDSTEAQMAQLLGGAHATSTEREKQASRMRMRLIVSLVCAIPLFYLCMGHVFGWPVPIDHHDPAQMLPFALVQLLLVIPIVCVNWSYFDKGFKTLFRGAPNMDSLIALGATASLVYKQPRP